MAGKRDEPLFSRPRPFARTLNSTTALGTVCTEHDVKRIWGSAGYRVSDGTLLDMWRWWIYLRGENRKKVRSRQSDEEQYAARKRASALRGREVSKEAQDIGPSHAPENPVRRESSRLNFREFCQLYMPRTFTMPFCGDHLRVIARIEDAVLRGGLFAMAMPRGAGKTSIAESSALWALLHGHHNFVALIGATEAQSGEMLQSLVAELEGNDLLDADFNEITHPVRALDGMTQRCAGQCQYGKPTHIGVTAGELTLPVVWNPEAILPAMPEAMGSGGIVRVTGLTGRIRGMKYKRPDGKSVRPSLVVIDDPQSDDSSRSLSQCATRERILEGAVLGLGGPGKKISGIMPCTVIRPGDVADTILNRDKHPAWNGERMRMLNRMPSDEKAWAKYAEIWAESLRKNGDISEATAYYLANRDRLDAGADASWPERFNPDEASAVQHAMNLKLRDEAAFMAEYQNEPLPEKTAEDEGMLVADQIATKLNGHKRGEVPPWAIRLTAGIDVGQKLLHWVVVAWSDVFDGAVIDWGSWPDQKRAYFTSNDARLTLALAAKGAGLEGSIYAGLESLSSKLLASEWKSGGGVSYKVERCLVDSGYKTDVIFQFCRQSVHAAVLLPSKGWGVTASSKSFEEWGRKTGERVGTGWKIPVPAARREIRHVIVDTNYWKSFLHSRLAVRMGDAGCLSLFGRHPDEHRVLADHLVSEYRVRTAGRGRVVDEWKQRAARPDNHLLDALVLATAGASIQGSGLKETGGAVKKLPRMSLASRMAANRERQNRGLPPPK